MNRLRTSLALKWSAAVLSLISILFMAIAISSLTVALNAHYVSGQRFRQSAAFTDSLFNELNHALGTIEAGTHSNPSSPSEGAVPATPQADGAIFSNTELGKRLAGEIHLISDNDSAVDYLYWQPGTGGAFSNSQAIIQGQAKRFDYVYVMTTDKRSQGYFQIAPSDLRVLPTNYIPPIHSVHSGVFAFNLKSTLPVGSSLYHQEALYNMAGTLYAPAWVCLILSSLLALLMLVYLCWSASYRPYSVLPAKDDPQSSGIASVLPVSDDSGNDGHTAAQPPIKKLAWIDAVPLEVLLGLSALFIAYLSALFYSRPSDDLLIYLYGPKFSDSLYAVTASIGPGIFFTILISHLIFLNALLSLIRRIRCHALWRTTLLAWLAHKAKKFYLYIKNDSHTKRYKIAGIAALLVYYLFFLLILISGAQAGTIIFMFLFAAFFPALYLFMRFRSRDALIKVQRHAENVALNQTPDPLLLKSLPQEFRPLEEALCDVNRSVATAVAERSRSERLKTQIITNVSHDLRTPLTSVINYVDLLQKEPMQTDAAKEYLGILAQKSQRLRTLTEDLIEASRAMSGALTVCTETISLCELLRQQSAEYDTRMKERSLTLILRLPDDNTDAPDAPWLCLTDPRRLARVLDNLLGNASKYALSGSRVYLSLTRVVTENGGTPEANPAPFQSDSLHQPSGDFMYRIEIKNVSETPITLSGEDLLARFVRGDSSRGGEGSGLGLSIAKSLCDLLQGRLEIDPVDDLFSATIYLPTAYDERRGKTQAEQQTETQRKPKEPSSSLR